MVDGSGIIIADIKAAAAAAVAVVAVVTSVVHSQIETDGVSTAWSPREPHLRAYAPTVCSLIGWVFTRAEAEIKVEGLKID